jgi:hypothetical protein
LYVLLLLVKFFELLLPPLLLIIVLVMLLLVIVLLLVAVLMMLPMLLVPTELRHTGAGQGNLPEDGVELLLLLLVGFSQHLFVSLCIENPLVQVCHFLVVCSLNCPRRPLMLYPLSLVHLSRLLKLFHPLQEPAIVAVGIALGSPSSGLPRTACGSSSSTTAATSTSSTSVCITSAAAAR